ncbi:MAG: HesA/MoeB/ThiF family protein [Spirochaetales bacterium]|nr:HesA/MoeB/ThiF family protein [Spirochaetales bacterium]
MNKDEQVILTAVQAHCEGARRLNGVRYQSLSVASVKRIAADLNETGKRVERIALENEIIPARYSRNITSIGPTDQVQLLGSTVTVVGIGGLGGWLSEMLARVGVGTLRLIDGDQFEESNLNRQLFSDEGHLALGKTDVAVERLTNVNSSITVDGRSVVLTEENGPALLSGCDVIADCLDSIRTRFVLESAAGVLGVPLVTAAVAGRSGQMGTILPGDPGFSVIYGQPAEAPERGEESELGNLPFTVALLASLQCAEIVRILLGKPELYRGGLLYVDLEDGTFEHLDLG